MFFTVKMSEETNEQVLSIITNRKVNENEVVSKTCNDAKTSNDTKTSSDKKNVNSMRGKPKSGRFWKSKKEKFSSINKTKGLQQDFAKKTALRLELKRTKELSKQLLEQHKQKEADRKERRRQNIIKSEENKRKAEVVQVITNTAKLKRMKKKQLRFIQKRDTNKQIEATK